MNFLAALAAVLVYEGIKRIIAAQDRAQDEFWDRKYRGKR